MPRVIGQAAANVKIRGRLEVVKGYYFVHDGTKHRCTNLGYMSLFRNPIGPKSHWSENEI